MEKPCFISDCQYNCPKGQKSWCEHKRVQNWRISKDGRGGSLNQQLNSWLRRGLEHRFCRELRGSLCRKSTPSPLLLKEALWGPDVIWEPGEPAPVWAPRTLSALLTMPVLTQPLLETVPHPVVVPHFPGRWCLSTFCHPGLCTHPAGLSCGAGFPVGFACFGFWCLERPALGAGRGLGALQGSSVPWVWRSSTFPTCVLGNTSATECSIEVLTGPAGNGRDCFV